jgi:hypothetical protein
MSTQTPGGGQPPAQKQTTAPTLTATQKFWYSMAGNQMRANGKMLEDMDDNKTGADDIAGLMLDNGGRAMLAYLKGDLKGWQSYLKLVADGIYESQGLIPPEPAPEG